MELNLLPLRAVFVPAVRPVGGTRDSHLMVVLHGRGDSPSGFAFLPEALQLDPMNYLLLQAPDDYFGGYSWYALPPDQAPGILRSRKLLQETFAQILRAGYQPERVFLFGFSQGCLMTLEFGSRFTPVLAGYIGVSGYALDTDAIILDSSPQIRSAPWLVTHGTLDDVLPVERTRAQMLALEAAGFNLEYVEYEKSHTIEDTQEIPYLRKWIAGKMA